MGWVFVVLGVAVFLFAMIDPRLIWEKTAGLKYKNPKANEPSDAVFVSQRAGAILIGLILVVVGLVVNSHATGNAAGTTATGPRSVVDKLAAAIQADSPLRVDNDPDSAADGTPRTVLAGATAMIDRELNGYEYQTLSRGEGRDTALAELFTITSSGKQYCLHLVLTSSPTTSTASKSWPLTTAVTDGLC